MADAGILCVLTEDDDMEARAARECTAVVELGCECHPDCQHLAALSCVRKQHADTENHRTFDGLEWRATTRKKGEHRALRTVPEAREEHRRL